METNNAVKHGGGEAKSLDTGRSTPLMTDRSNRQPAFNGEQQAPPRLQLQAFKSPRGPQVSTIVSGKPWQMTCSTN